MARGKIRDKVRWMALAALLTITPVGGTLVVNALPVSNIASHGQAALHVRKSGGDQQEYLTVRKQGGDQQEYLAMRKAGGAKEIIAI